MSQALDPPRTASGDAVQALAGSKRLRLGEAQTFAALDLGTNNCRLLIARPSDEGFRIVESYSNIVRLGEGLSRTGRLQDHAMDRALAALKICADKITRRRCARVRAVATQACRGADNGAAFIERVRRETGLQLQIITPKEEAHLSVAGCLNLLDPLADAALVVDVGGGSTELSWIDLKGPILEARRAAPLSLPIAAWISVPIGVVTLAEQVPEDAADPADRPDWYRRMVRAFKARIVCPDAQRLRAAFEAGRGQIVGTSGAITSLAGIHLGLKRYDRQRVDGLWMTRAECEATAGKLLALDLKGRALEPCIGPERADLVLAGAAILQAVQELWPCPKVRVADRGLREGLLLSMMAAPSRRRRRRRGGGRPRPPATEAAE